MTTITGFLLARITDDEEAALTASTTREYATQWDAVEPVMPPSRVEARTGDRIRAVADVQREGIVQHIARWDPARVLAECAAKRAIIEQHATQEVAGLDRATWGQAFLVCRVCAVVSRQIVAPCPTLRALAAVYADHPDYQPEWAL